MCVYRVPRMEIKKCKYCGKVPEIQTYEDYDSLKGYCFLMCDNDDCDSEIMTDFYGEDFKTSKAREDCINQWNKLNS